MGNKVWTVGWSIDKTQPVCNCLQTECCVKGCDSKTNKKFLLKNEHDTKNIRWKAPVCENCSTTIDKLDIKIHFELQRADPMESGAGS